MKPYLVNMAEFGIDTEYEKDRILVEVRVPCSFIVYNAYAGIKPASSLVV